MKIGDLVYSEEFGKGKIICISADEQPYGVKFENYNIELHDLGGRCKDGYGYWCTDDKSHNKPGEIITPYKFISTKQDLQKGDKLTTKGGAELIFKYSDGVNFKEIGDAETKTLQFLSELNEDLTMQDREDSIDDIVKVERPTYETVFERKEEILDEKEKEYLLGVIRPFKDKVEYIKKYDCGCDEYIEIYYKEDVIMLFPNFERGTMYKGMEVDKKYTLKELGLDD